MLDPPLKSRSQEAEEERTREHFRQLAEKEKAEAAEKAAAAAERERAAAAEKKRVAAASILDKKKKNTAQARIRGGCDEPERRAVAIAYC